MVLEERVLVAQHKQPKVFIWSKDSGLENSTSNGDLLPMTVKGILLMIYVVVRIETPPKQLGILDWNFRALFV